MDSIRFNFWMTDPDRYDERIWVILISGYRIQEPSFQTGYRITSGMTGRVAIRITSGMTITSNMPNECGTIGIPGAETTACAKSFGTRNSDVLFQRKKAKEEFSSSFAFLGFSYGQANPAHTFLTNHHELIWGRFRSSR